MNTAEDRLPLPQRYWAILTLVTGLVVSVLDSSIANIALPTIAREIGASPAGSSTLISSPSSYRCCRWLRSATSSAIAAST